VQSTTPELSESIWSEAEKRAWRPPEQLRTSEWAEKYRRLPKTNPLGDKWYNANSPALIGLMDLADRPGVREIWLKKAGQIGGTAAVHNILGRRAHLDPAPALIVMPNEKDGRKQIRGEIFPLFRETTVLAEQRIGRLDEDGHFRERRADFKGSYIHLANGFEMHLGYSGSASSLASRAFRDVLLDETDKYELFAGRESSPVELARIRVRKFDGRSLIVGLSTPTTSDGVIAIEHGNTEIKLRYHVPCPTCGHCQPLHQDQLKWEKPQFADPKDLAAWVVEHKAAWFECTNPVCRAKILDSHKRQIVPRGFWATDDMGWRLYPDHHEEGEKPPGTRIGVHYPAFYDYQTHWYDVAADMIRAGKDPIKLMSLYNSTFGEDFKIQVATTEVNTFARRCIADPASGFVPPKAGIIPPWASRLLLTIDTQKDYFWFVVRAWGYQARSQRIAHGRLLSFEQIEELLYRTRWHYEGESLAPLGIFRAGIDSGGGLTDQDRPDSSRTDEVYRWCNFDPVYRLALKGSSKPLEQPVRWKKSLYSPPGQKDQPYERIVHLVDGGYARDILSSHIGAMLPVVNTETGESLDVLQFGLNDQNDDEYNRQMANVAKMIVTKGRTKMARWGPRTTGARHDYHDCEAYQIALAIGMNFCTSLPSLEQLKREVIPVTAPASTGSGYRRPDGRPWFGRR
jgi:phage terminase large subunit GpA-like protein